MERPIWKGSISFGLVNIPVELFSAEKSCDLHFHLLDSRNQARIHYERINDETGKEVPWNQVVKAFEFDKNGYVIIDEEEFKKVSPKATKTIDIEDFVALKDIDYPYFNRPYYLVPQKNTEKGYILLREALKTTQKVGIAKIIIRSKEYIAAVIPLKNALILNLLRFYQELRPEEDFDLPNQTLKAHKITNRELEMATQLIKNMTASWNPKKYQDEYRKALMEWIEEKATHKKTHKTKVKKETFNESEKIVDFMTLLKKSLDTNKISNKRKSNLTKIA